MENYGGIEMIGNPVLKIVFYPSFEQELQVLNQQSGLNGDTIYWLSGRWFDDYSVCHFIGVTDVPTKHSIGVLTDIEGLFTDVSQVGSKIGYPLLLVSLNEDLSNLKIIWHQSEKTILTPEIKSQFVDLDRLYVRIDQTETPLGELEKKTVAIIGMGSGGSLLALYLAKSGVQNFIFIDDDILETHNIIRHICDLSHLGRFKTRAVKDYILARIPDMNILTVERKFSLHTKADFEFYFDLLRNVDLIAAVSGEHEVNYAINDFVHSNHLPIPLVYAGTFEGVKGGLMFKVDPRKEDYCYHCVYAKPEGSTSALPTTMELERRISYDRTMQEQLAQPGLGLDIDNLTLILAKFSLDILLVNVPHGLYHFPFNFYMWYNRNIKSADKTAVKYEGLELYYYEDLTFDPDCPFHGSLAISDTQKKSNTGDKSSNPPKNDLGL